MGGLFYLEDVVFSFQPESYCTAIQQWIDQASASGESFSEKDFEGHVRDEYSTYSWIMEAMIERTGFAIRKSEFRSPTIASYICEKVSDAQGVAAVQGALGIVFYGRRRVLPASVTPAVR
jgi:putative AdoMet-dependent methyltransferase